MRSTVQTAVALAPTNSLESKDFPEIYPEFVQKLISIWHTLPRDIQNTIWETLPAETQHTLWHKLSKKTGDFWCNFLASKKQKHIENGIFLNIENMDQNQILRAVAQKRIEQYPSLREAAKSLNIDTRTLQKHAQWKEPDE